MTLVGLVDLVDADEKRNVGSDLFQSVIRSREFPEDYFLIFADVDE